MFKVSHTVLIVLSGLIWLAIGCFLLPLGLNFIVGALLKENFATQSHPILTAMAPFVGGGESAALIWIALALAIGFFKGRFVFGKTVQRSVNRILSLPNPVHLSKIYPWQYYLLLSSMILLGFLVKFLPLDIRGGVDVIIGSALINGAMLYFRQAFAVRKPKVQT